MKRAIIAGGVVLLALAGCATTKSAPAASQAICLPCIMPCTPESSCGQKVAAAAPVKAPAPVAAPAPAVAPAPPDPCAPGNAHTPDQCPDLDDDGDGVANSQDKCPLVNGPRENQGCPDVDADNDGVPDRLDKCPNEPGTAEYQGCPPPQKAAIAAGKIEIKEAVFFDSGKATIQQRSFGLLDDVAQVLKGHAEVKKVIVEGHTDSVGSAQRNKKLSASRASAVRDYLVGKGVEADRLEPKGFGATRPIANNKTAAGREKNRRVDFVIP
jgi:OmpA-OmpF porin, OOP family